MKINNEIIQEMKEKKCSAMVGVFSYGLRTNYLLGENMQVKEITNIVIFKDGKVLLSIGKYFRGQVDGIKIDKDIKKVFLSEVKTRRKINLDREENFYHCGTLYLYDGLDISVGETKEIIKYQNNISINYGEVATIKFKNSIVYYNSNREEIESNMLLVDVVGSYRIEKTPQGEKIDSIEKELKENNIDINKYMLEKLLDKYDLIKK